MRKLYALLLAILLLTPLSTFGKGGHGSSSKPSSTHVSHTKTHVRESEKTVHVHAYTKKDGTHVGAYNRRPPNTINNGK